MFQSIATKKPFAVYLASQLPSNMDLCMQYTRAFERQALLPFDMQYILTYPLSQETIEHLFGAMCAKGGLFAKPSPLQFKYRLRKYQLARNTETFGSRGNVEFDGTEWLCLKDTSVENLKKFLTDDEAIFAEFKLSELAFPNDIPEKEIDSIYENALDYTSIAGFIVRKLGLTQHVSNESTYTWVDEVPRGALTKPTTEFLSEVKNLEDVFKKFNGDQLIRVSNICKSFY